MELAMPADAGGDNAAIAFVHAVCGVNLETAPVGLPISQEEGRAVRAKLMATEMKPDPVFKVPGGLDWKDNLVWAASAVRDEKALRGSELLQRLRDQAATHQYTFPDGSALRLGPAVVQLVGPHSDLFDFEFVTLDQFHSSMRLLDELCKVGAALGFEKELAQWAMSELYADSIDQLLEHEDRRIRQWAVVMLRELKSRRSTDAGS